MLKEKVVQQSLADRFPNLIKEWHPSKNGSLNPYKCSAFSSKKAWWKCSCGHEWETVVYYRARGVGCPQCTDSSKRGKLLIKTHPELMKEWHPEKNTNLKIETIKSGSNLRVWWRCEKGHEWQSLIKHRCKGTTCPYCSGKKVASDNSLAIINPNLAKQWHPFKNGKLTPADVRPGSNAKVWWTCRNGHVWQAKIVSRNRGTGCRLCHSKNC